MSGLLILTQRSVAAQPGGEVTLICRVRNTGQVVDQYTLAVLGPAAAFAASEPVSLSLFPGADGEIALRLRPPISVPAGQIPFGVRLNSAVEPGATVVEEGTLAVGAFVAVSARLVPRTCRSRSAGKHRLLLTNTGNTPARVRVSASDPDDVLRFRSLGGAAVELGPGQRQEVRIRYRSTATHMTGPPENHPFTVSVVPEGAAPVPVEGSLMQRPAVSGWMIAAVVGALALVALIVVLRQIGGANPSPGGTLAVAPTAPGASAAGSPSASPAPTPASAATPTPGSNGGVGGGKGSPPPATVQPRTTIPQLTPVPLLYVHGGGSAATGDIFTIAGGSEQNLTNNPTLDYQAVSYSPDGTRVAFVAHASTAGGAPNAIYVAGAQLGTASQIDGNCGCTTVAWSPDGSLLAYANGDQLVTMQPAANSPPQVLVSASSPLTGLAWSPDSSFIAYGVAKGQLLAVGRNGGNPVTLAAGTSVTGVTFSPDGTRIAYSLALAGGPPQIYVATIDLGSMAVSAPHRVTPAGRAGRAPKWSRDGTTIYYSAAGAGGNPEVWSMDPGGGGARQVTNSSTAVNGNGEPEA